MLGFGTKQLVVATLMLAGCSSATSSTSSTHDPSPIPASTVFPSTGASPVRELLVVAHQDDDLLFANPDLGRTLQNGGALGIVYLTGGDDGRDASYYLEREVGVQAAYANLMAITEPHWTESVFSTGGHAIIRRDLSGTELSLFFLRLPDGNGDGNGFLSSRGTPGGSLAKLWDGRLAALRVLDSTDSYSRAALIQTLSSISDAFDPTQVGTLDAAGANGRDHSDHRHAALFAQDGLSSEIPMRSYRGYNVVDEAPNIDGDEAATKWSAFLAYAAHDANLCHSGTCDQKLLGVYSAYPSRQYLSSRGSTLTGQIASTSGLCLDGSGEAPVASTCRADSAAQTFTLGSDGQLEAGGRCLTVGLAGVVMTSCSLLASGPRWKSEGQRWSLLSSGNLVSAAGPCLRAPQVAGGAVSASPCTLDAYASWGSRFKKERVVDGADSAFDTASLLAGDIDGTGQLDFCVRSAAGIECWIDRAGARTTTRITKIFSDASGWSPPAYRDSIRMADVDTDGLADICGWKGDGITCAFGEGKGTFGPPILVARDFDRPLTSFGIGDVDGDRHPDLCAVLGTELRCALGAGRVFAPSEKWLGNIYSVASDHWVYVDVSHDGRADACEVTKEDVDCAVTQKGHVGFVRQRTWALRDPKTNLQFSTLSFADIDGDGDADVCGLSDAGIECAKSSGSAFGTFLLAIPRPPFDPTWGTNFSLVHRLSAKRAEACRWGTFGVACSAAP